MSGTDLIRGRVYAAVLPHVGTEKYFVVVSNDQRNRHLDQVLAVRLTSSAKPDLASIVRLGRDEPFTGSVVCDDIVELWSDEVTREMGALSPRAMSAIDRGLAAALAL